MQIIQFVLFCILGLFAVFLLASGAIGYLIYYVSNGSPPVEVQPIELPHWNELSKEARQAIVAGLLAIGMLWVLTPNQPKHSEKEEDKGDRKGRKRRYDNED